MTIDALNIFGIEIERGDGFYQIKSQAYKSPGRVEVEGDWSNAAFWLCAGAIGAGEVTCTGLNLNSNQGDIAVIRLLEAFGAAVTYGQDSVTVKPSRDKLRGIRIDAENTPDLVPVISAVAAVAKGETVIYNAARLRIKESDRLQTVSETLSTLGADITETPDGLIISGAESLKGGTVSSYGDHRIAMTAAVASCVCEGAVTINGAEAVDKSYPGFFRDFESLGGKVTEGG
jgi:3-phosphoshikimate 1-carboxyvinyltransferase